ncbi:TonB family protein [Halomonas sp.]|uniref:energy transducer TonB n=1 Tax=Halomonas sp. TaxID=1486246 RepID=UPI003D0DFC91
MTPQVSDPVQYAPVTRPYRRWLAASLALLLHLAVIGSVASWQFAAPPPERSSLDVVLVTRESQAPVDADAIAEAAQEAAGSRQEEAPAESRSAPVEAPAASQQGAADVDPATPAEPESAERVAPEARPDERAPSAANRVADQAPSTPREAPQAADAGGEPSVAAPSASGRDLLADATRSIREQGLAPESPGETGAPRQAAERAAEARYIDDWTRRVEAYGNRVHPAPRHLHGQLRIRVVIGREGELRQAEVIQSSGHPELDQAALDTVHGAAPYRPFDAGMGNLDSLSITRVWRFGEGNHYGVR